jgi:hypothetical protein
MIRAFCLAATFLGVAGMGLAATAGADDDDTVSDEMFSKLLSDDGLLFNFPLEKHEGQRWCEAVIGGESRVQASQDLQSNGAYSWDVAEGIGAAAGVSYCMCASSAAITGDPGPPSSCSSFEKRYRRGE